MAVSLINKNYNTNVCIFAFDSWESDKDKLPNLNNRGKDSLYYVYSCSQGSKAVGTDGTNYVLTGENKWVKYSSSNGGSSGSSGSLEEFEIATITFDSINDTFDLPVDNTTYNVYVNGMYYTESVDYNIDTSTSPNKIIFNDIYNVEDTCTLTYLKSTGSSGDVGGSCECEDLEYMTDDDIYKMFK